MKYQGNAREITEQIVSQFKSGQIVKPLSQVFFQHQDLPSGKYSANNRLIIAITGLFRNTNYSGAAGFNYWKSIGRHVRKGERAINILAPMSAKKDVTNEKTGQTEKKTYIYGFKSIPVFGLEQTLGDPIPDVDNREDFIKSLPFLEVAREWELSVSIDTSVSALGYYSPSGKRIGLNTRNLSTWAHELCHASDDKLHKLTFGQNREQEAIAELGGAVLLSMIGQHYDADVGGAWEYIKSYSENDDDAIRVVMSILDRTIKCIDLIINTATEIEARTATVA